ncbi:MAG: DEAD/DEAH box helicase [Planctomycetes bacterium]|nr:DEAD/DEAH box helicase [Planctomycetota bacterium]
MDERIVFHRAQAHVYRLLMEGKNVALSAPTSFGKSLIIDAMIASERFNQIVIVVPTLALIDETRRRLTGKFRVKYKVITHSTQKTGDRNIFVLTQERVLERNDWTGIDFFVIDEFYKLAPRGEVDDRCTILNQALYMLAKSGAQFYMLGPNIRGITEQNHLRVEISFVNEPHFHTVATEVHRFPATEDELASLITVCKQLDSPTIVFCRSPSRASEVARQMVAAGLGTSSTRTSEAAKWVSDAFDSEWHFAQALERGIGIHHGRIPRALAQFVVRCFNDGDIRFLVCTSTLIEGVNTRARNIIVLDNTINKEQIDLFTFNNIKGRSGRMWQYFVGHVFVFHADPLTELPFVDVPALSQSDGASDSLLVQMEEGDLTDQSKDKLAKYQQQTVLDIGVIRANKALDPVLQLQIATRLTGESATYLGQLAWTGMPKYPQLKQICELIFAECGGAKLGSGSARTAGQLTAMIRNLYNSPTIRDLIANQKKFSATTDEAVTTVLDFLRLWVRFHFPRLLRGISRIQQDVLQRMGRPYGNYDFFAARVENLFLDPSILAMDEYGIPLEVARKLSAIFSTDGDLDVALDRLRGIDVGTLRLSAFESELVRDAQEHV